MVQARIANVIHSFVDYPTPDDTSITVFLTGCSHNCKNCHNKELQNFYTGTETTIEQFWDSLSIYSEQYKTNKVVLQGGDPLFHWNYPFVSEFINMNKKEKKYEICIYTGYSIERVKSLYNAGDVSYWKCGLYDETKKQESGKTDTCFTLASSNQEFYNTKFKRISRKGKLRFVCGKQNLLKKLWKILDL